MFLPRLAIHSVMGEASRVYSISLILYQWAIWHDYTIGTLDVLQACDACADMGMTYSVIVQCTDCVVFRPFAKSKMCA